MTKRACLGIRNFIFLILFSAVVATIGRAQPMLPPDPFVQLCTWSFDDTSWYSDLGYPPVSFTNLNNPPSFDGNALQVDSTNAAWMQYNIVEADSTTNLTFNEFGGTIEMWVLPDWNSGTGPGDWGRLIDVGAFSTNSPSSWWSLYFSPDGTGIFFSSETNGVFNNYLNSPISWDTNTWHFLALTYNRFHSELYIDGQLATNGFEMEYVPSADVVTNGFFVGSDNAGLAQSRVLIDDMVTYNYALTAYEVTNDYVAGLQILNGGGFHIGGGGFSDGDPGLPGGGGGGGTNDGDGGSGYALPNYGTNLWIAQVNVFSNLLTALVSNTFPDILYEIQGRTNLVFGNWISFGFFDGSELTNCVPISVPANQQGNLFLQIRSWQDSNDSGIPDWWWLFYFGQITNVDATASAAGDGYSNLQKFQMGLNPTNYFNTNPPSGFFGTLDSSGTNIVIEWSPSPGPVVNYVIQRGILDTNTGNYDFSQFLLSSNATFFKDYGAISNDNSWNDIYNLQAVYPGGTLTATNTWYAWYAQSGWSGLPYGAPTPNDAYAYAEPNGTNVLFSWTSPQGAFGLTNYIVWRGIFDTNIEDYDYAQIATLNTNTTLFQDVGAIQNSNDWNDVYEVEAVFPGGGVSQPATANISAGIPPPTDFSAVVDSTGTNVVLSWTPPQGVTITNYIIERGIYNTNTGTYSFSQVGQVNGSSTTFDDVGAITGNNSFNNGYQVQAVATNGDMSSLDDFYLGGPPSPTFDNNNPISACLVRNEAGSWQLMFSYIPPTVQYLDVVLNYYDYNLGNNFGGGVQTNVLASSITNGIYIIPNNLATNLLDIADNGQGAIVLVQPVMSNGIAGNFAQAGFIYNDAPYFVDGSQHLKQNLLFELRAATVSWPVTLIDVAYDEFYNETYTIPVDDNYVESSIFHWSVQNKQYGVNLSPSFLKMEALWPFNGNYQLHDLLYDPANPSVPSAFAWTNNLATVPAPAVLDIGEPYWIYQNPTNVADAGGLLASDGSSISIETGVKNLYGLNLSAGAGLRNSTNAFDSSERPIWVPLVQFDLSPGDSYTFQNGESLANYYSDFQSPTLALASYFFSAINTPGTALPNYIDDNQIQPNPIPANTGFAATNQTGLIVGSVGQPMVVGGWAKFGVEAGSTPTGKYAYLGQYFVTNALLVNSGSVTTNSAGIISPYGEFFPMQAGTARLVTMPDIDTGAQGTCAVRVVSLNVDANHDGVMNFQYNSPDFVSSSRPFRFWANDDQDSGDFGGNYGIPGLLYPQADGWNFTDQAGTKNYDANGAPIYHAHGRRDLVDFFPVYLNIGSLFQSNAWSAAINPLDTNYTFALSHVDSALRFAYTDLTPTNYMNFLRDTIESSNLAYTALTTVTNGIVPLSSAFLAGIATNNQGIILVEAAFPTDQPLVLTIYHGTNQIAQTSLPLSISGVEDMFRHKNLLLNTPPAMPDRLTDADVPNEPDTIDKNFVFLHGYNVNPNEARGVQSDMFKRMYWSGSHAKFYGVTWEGSDSKIGSILTPNYHTNVVNAFNTAPLLANFIASLTNSGPVVTAAHSLGNMLTLSAISDWHAPISQYFMMDAAVPIEAIDPASTNLSFMTFSTWTGYSNRLFAAYWYQLFPTNDARSTLFWNNRLGNLGSVDVYNFYSSGEEVLRLTAGDPPLSTINTLATQLINRFSLVGLWPDVPFGTYTWYWQEKGKGTCSGDGLIGSSHGGWKFSTYWVNGFGNPLSPSIMNDTTNTLLQTQPMFDFNSTTSTALEDVDSELLGDVTGVDPSTYAAANRNRILSDAIPAMSLVAGANPIPKFNPTGHNIDMMTLENGWSPDRTGDEAGMWHHSDFVQMAYTFTHQLFETFVTTGNLK